MKDEFFLWFLTIYSNLYKQLQLQSIKLEKLQLELVSIGATDYSASIMDLGGSKILGMGIITDLALPKNDDINHFSFSFGVYNTELHKWKVNFDTYWGSYTQGPMPIYAKEFEYESIEKLLNELEDKFTIFFDIYKHYILTKKFIDEDEIIKFR